MIVPKNNTQTPRPDDCEWHPERLQLAQSIAASDPADPLMHRALSAQQSADRCVAVRLLDETGRLALADILDLTQVAFS